MWRDRGDQQRLRAGHLIIAEREANHARLLAERIRALDSEPAWRKGQMRTVEQFAELVDLKGFITQLTRLQNH